MSTVEAQVMLPRRSALIWLMPLQAAAVFTVLAIAGGAQTLRAWLLSALIWVMALPLLVSLEAGLIAMMLFEPFRGVIRRAQYLLVDYSSQDPIHLITPVVTLLAFSLLLKSQRLAIFRASPLAGAVSLLATIYFLEIFNPLQGTVIVGLAGALFMFVPLVWFFFGQAVKEEFILTVLRLMVVVGVVASLYGIYQLVFGYPGFEQYWIDNTEFYESIAVGRVQRALATFSSAEEWGRYTELGAIAAFGFAAAAKLLRARAAWIFCGLVLSGFVMVTGQRAAVFGLILGLAVLVLLGAKNLRGAVSRAVLLLIPALLIAVLVKPPSEEEMWNKDNNEAIGTLWAHTERGTLKPADEESFQVRLENWAYVATSVIPYRPLGAGLGAGNLGQRRFNSDYELPPLDSSIVQQAIACGVPGVLLFLWILSQACWLSLRAARRTPRENTNATVKRTVAAMMCALVLNSAFGYTFTLYSVAPLAWLLIGWISAETLRSRRKAELETETMVI